MSFGDVDYCVLRGCCLLVCGVCRCALFLVCWWLFVVVCCLLSVGWFVVCSFVGVCWCVMFIVLALFVL